MINTSDYLEATTPKPADVIEGHTIDGLAGDTAILPPKHKPHGVWLLGHCVVGLLMVLVMLTPMGYNLPVYPIEFSTPISVWWGVNPKVKNSGNPEMVVPTYFFLGSVLPVVVGAVLMAYMRAKASVFISPFSTLLHRKPRLFKHKVSYGELLFLMVMFVGNAIVFSYQYKKRFKPSGTTNDRIKAIATSLGFSGLYNLIFLSLPASRHSLWMEWLNIPFANGVKYHRWLGVASIVSFVVHTIVFVVYYVRTKTLSKMLPCFDCDVAVDGKMNWENLFGELSLLCMLVMGATSLPYVRRHYYSVFYATHFLFIPASLFAVLHWGNIIYFLFTSMVLYMVNRLLSTSSITTPVAIKRAVPVSSDVVEISFECTTGYNPGDAVWIKVPALSKTQWHPFSLYVTQEDATEFDFYDDKNGNQTKKFSGQEDSLPRSFDIHQVHMEPKPYTHANTLKRVLILVLCFAFSCALVAVATHGYVLATFSSARWIVLRTVQFFAVVVGCYLAYFVVRLPKTPIGVAIADDGGRHAEKAMRADDVTEHFQVQTGRADLAQTFQTIQAHAAGSFAVYVCGPKSLVRAVDKLGHGKFPVHHEDFEM
ncbi:hypothetical protein H310_00410 [Aphanomyces invadans]|uniref:Ferric oxidoreductase domain-containing protein n=1 Tax=Aphanomyces invadans TaxID=157072 RepID=A0A024UU04_9STRA|nr:hypothetical protein H310_00410 [Aphanomyces invadans]ETW10001.1 hypothetical protein H310_00410 [Aphanomyces invadans]|eukprot:XP_008861412.1 hypothetical protein H310_00410 [Aphanomyces invadans]